MEIAISNRNAIITYAEDTTLKRKIKTEWRIDWTAINHKLCDKHIDLEQIDSFHRKFSAIVRVTSVAACVCVCGLSIVVYGLYSVIIQIHDKCSVYCELTNINKRQKALVYRIEAALAALRSSMT